MEEGRAHAGIRERACKCADERAWEGARASQPEQANSRATHARHTLTHTQTHTHRAKKWEGETPAAALRSYMVDEILYKTAKIMPGKL